MECHTKTQPRTQLKVLFIDNIVSTTKCISVEVQMQLEVVCQWATLLTPPTANY